MPSYPSLNEIRLVALSKQLIPKAQFEQSAHADKRYSTRGATGNVKNDSGEKKHGKNEVMFHMQLHFRCVSNDARNSHHSYHRVRVDVAVRYTNGVAGPDRSRSAIAVC